MTSNQIAYWNYREGRRHNKAGEAIEHAKIALQRDILAETIRSNKAREIETRRSNISRETETMRSNLAKELENSIFHTQTIQQQQAELDQEWTIFEARQQLATDQFKEDKKRWKWKNYYDFVNTFSNSVNSGTRTIADLVDAIIPF